MPPFPLPARKPPVRARKVATRLASTLLALTLSIAGCLGAESTAPRLTGNARVLFIGNSLTYFNDLGTMMALVAQSVRDTAMRTATVAFPDYALEDHLADGAAAKALRDSRWEYVVMQQGPSSLPANQQLLIDGAKRFEPLVRAAGAEPVLYMVWPQRGRMDDFPAVRVSYRNAAASVRGIFAPVGDAWVAGWEADPSLPLYNADGLHPSPAGTYLAAIVILHQIRGIEPTTLPRRIPGHVASEELVSQLQHAAQRAIARNPLRP